MPTQNERSTYMQKAFTCHALSWSKTGRQLGLRCDSTVTCIHTSALPRRTRQMCVAFTFESFRTSKSLTTFPGRPAACVNIGLLLRCLQHSATSVGCP
eukprot:6192568-Pleurochrysis_carterae.AAC.2